MLEAAWGSFLVSRIDLRPLQRSVLSCLLQALPTMDQLRKLQHQDPSIKKIFSWIRSGRNAKELKDLPHAWRRYAEYLHEDDKLLWYRPRFDLLLDGELDAVIVIPEEAVELILAAYHNDEMLVHPRNRAMQSMLRRRFFWPKMRTDIQKHIYRCSTCDRTVTGRRHSAVSSKTLLVQEPCSVVSIDLYGKLPMGKDKMQYILSMQCQHRTGFLRNSSIPETCALYGGRPKTNSWVVNLHTRRSDLTAFWKGAARAENTSFSTSPLVKWMRMPPSTCTRICVINPSMSWIPRSRTRFYRRPALLIQAGA